MSLASAAIYTVPTPEMISSSTSSGSGIFSNPSFALNADSPRILLTEGSGTMATNPINDELVFQSPKVGRTLSLRSFDRHRHPKNDNHRHSGNVNHRHHSGNNHHHKRKTNNNHQPSASAAASASASAASAAAAEQHYHHTKSYHSLLKFPVVLRELTMVIFVLFGIFCFIGGTRTLMEIRLYNTKVKEGKIKENEWWLADRIVDCTINYMLFVILTVNTVLIIFEIFYQWSPLSQNVEYGYNLFVLMFLLFIVFWYVINYFVVQPRLIQKNKDNYIGFEMENGRIYLHTQSNNNSENDSK